MGTVYLAQQSRPRRVVAVKVFMPSLFLDTGVQDAFLIRFRREADAIATLDHVNIMPIFEYGEQEDLAYLVMPYVAGGTLRQVIEKRGMLPFNDILSIVEQIAAGLDYAHARGIIHRDLKPGNILFHSDGRVLLTDFGIAKILNDTNEASSEALATLTGTGMVIGTPEYFSPEQATGSLVDRRTDVYSLGVMLYQMLGGRVPFTGTTPVAIAVKHTVEPPPPLSQLNPAIPPGVEAVVMKALAKKPEQRYNSAGELAHALRAALAAPSSPVQPPTREEEDSLVPVTLMSNDTIDTSRTIAEPVQQAPAEATTPMYYTPVQPGRSSNVINTSITPSIRERPEKRRGYLSTWMAIIGAALAIILVVGGFYTYTTFIANHPNGGGASTSSSRSAATSTTAAQATSTAGNPGSSAQLPKALVPVENMLYGTTQPACDPHSNSLWHASNNAHVNCTASGLGLTDSSTNLLAGVFLNTLPNSASYPKDYVVQVQVTVNSASSGGFGVFFRNQPGHAQQGAYAFLVYPQQNRWEANSYDNNTGARTLIYGSQLTANVQGTVTIDVVVQGSTFQFYINGQKQGGVISPTYPSGTIGLAADTGANVYFKNLALYAAPAG